MQSSFADALGERLAIWRVAESPRLPMHHRACSSMQSCHCVLPNPRIQYDPAWDRPPRSSLAARCVVRRERCYIGLPVLAHHLILHGLHTGRRSCLP